MQETKTILHGIDRDGENINIEYSGSGKQFSGLDLHIKATKYMILHSLSQVDVELKEGNFEAIDKTAALLLNEIGEYYRHSSSDPEAWGDTSNMDIVKYIMENQFSHPEVVECIEEDNRAIKREQKAQDEIELGFLEEWKKK